VGPIAGTVGKLAGNPRRGKRISIILYMAEEITYWKNSEWQIEVDSKLYRPAAKRVASRCGRLASRMRSCARFKL
jgi:hypothetical protein